MLAELVLDGPPPADAPMRADYEVGARSRNLELELQWILSTVHSSRVRFGLQIQIADRQDDGLADVLEIGFRSPHLGLDSFHTAERACIHNRR